MANSTFVEKAQKKASEEIGVDFERDVPVLPKKRGARIWGKYHTILRDLQEEIADERDVFQSRIDELNERNTNLLGENRVLERQNEGLMLRQRFIDQGMSPKDQKFYLPEGSKLEQAAAEAMA